MKKILMLVLAFAAVESFAESYHDAGTRATRSTKRKAGLYVLDVTHQNTEGNFVVYLKSDNGGSDLLVNSIGSYRGKVLVRIPDDGNYFFDVRAVGTWDLKFDTPQRLYSQRSFSGRGSVVSPFLELDQGKWQFKIKNQGKGNFMVNVWTEDGAARELLVNEIGNYEGAPAVVLPKGKYVVEIRSDGSWELQVKPGP